MEPLLKAEEMTKIYSQRKVVDQVNIDLFPGEVVGLLGPNGAGKTTTFFLIVGAVHPNKGRISFCGKNISKLPMYRRARLGIGFLPQEPSVFRKLTVANNLNLVLEMQGLKADERKKRREELLSAFSLEKLKDSQAYTLSGGERRRCEIARALTTNPKLILLDEPFTGIDPIAIDEIEKAIALLKAEGLGVLITDHNVQATLHIVDRAYILHEGKIIATGTREEVANDPLARKYYLGDRFQLES